MTRRDHPSGTDRIAEVAAHSTPTPSSTCRATSRSSTRPASTCSPELLDVDPDPDMATLAVPITDREVYLSPNVVKVVCDDRGRALYFTRSPIPMVRDGEPDFAARPARFLQHLGLYAYRRDFLLRLAAMPPHPLEQTEKLEQLRVLGIGGPIRVGVVARAHAAWTRPTIMRSLSGVSRGPDRAGPRKDSGTASARAGWSGGAGTI